MLENSKMLEILWVQKIGYYEIFFEYFSQLS